jgi:hypothetical protein
MTITINGDLVLDERAGLQNDDDDLSWSSFQTALSAPLYSRLFSAGGLNLPANTTGASTFPQVATQAGLITLSAPVNDLQLVKDAAGGAFDGVDSGWTDLAGNHIFLYADSGSNIVLGRAGTGATANPTGAIDMAIVLDEHLTSGLVTSADLYLLQFTALKEPGVNLVDAADVLDLTNKVYVASFTSNTVEFNDFSKVPSGSDNWTIIQPSAGGTDPDILVTALVASDTVEVSTQGLGEGSQALNQFEGLRFDFVTGGAGGAGPSPDPLTNPQVHDDSKIAYTGHQLGSGGGFQISQVNPGSSSTTVTAKIAAYDAAGNFQGADFKAHVGDQTAVNITTGSVVVTNAANVVVTAGITVDYTGDTVVIGGLKNGYHIAFTTDGAMDRFTVQNVTSQSNRSFDVTDIKFNITTMSGDNVEVGSHLVTEDDGPSITAVTNTGASVVHDETPGVQADTDSGGSAIAYGAATIASLFAGAPSPGDDPDVAGTGPIGYAASASGLITVTGGSAGADGPASTELTYALSVTNGTDSGLTTTDGSKIFLFNGTGAAAGLVLGRVGADAGAAATGTTAFALADDPTSGKVFLAQYLSLHHGNTASADEQVNLAAGSVFMSVTRTDGDGDTATDSDNDISLRVGFQDDGPTITAVTNTGASVVHDETPGVQADTDSAGSVIAYGAATIASLFAGAPSPGDDPDVAGTGPIGYAASAAGLVTLTGGDAGADGPASTELSYALSVTNGTDSGLTTTDGSKIFLFNGTGAAAGLVLGRVGATAAAAATGTTAFALADDPTSGKVFLAQYLSLHHNNTASADEQVNLAAGSVFMSVTRTDGDGDTATDSNNDISLQVGFQDDGPTITAVTNTGASVVHDETPGIQADTDIAGGVIAYGAATIASLFAGVPSPGDDPDVTGTGPIGYAASAAGLVAVTGGDAGADGPASTELTYALSVTNGTDSGLTTTDGSKIFLFNGTGAAAGLVLGRVGATAATAATGTTAFALADDPTSGKVFLAQYLSLSHGNTASADEQINLAAGSLFMSATRTDGDGDTATDSNNDISLQIGFQDDGPAISTSLTGSNVAFAKNAFFTESTGANPGADGGTVTIDATSIVLPTGFTDTITADGQHMTIKDASNTAIYQLDVTATNYTFTVLQDAPPAFIPLNFAAIPSGSPMEVLTVNATGTSTNITFDGLVFTGTGAIGSTLGGSVTNPGGASTVDDLNPNSVGFGEKGGQASQMNQNEGFVAFDAAHALMSGLKFDIAGVGSVKAVNVEWWMLDSSNNVINHAVDHVVLPGGAATITEIIDTGQSFDHLDVRFFYMSPDSTTNSGVRVENFETKLPNSIPDREVDFALNVTDGDGDVVHSNLVDMFVLA